MESCKAFVNLRTLFGGIPWSVLAKNLPTTDLNDDDAIQALFESASPYMPATVASDADDWAAGSAASDLDTST
jgi:hypothetical protein